MEEGTAATASSPLPPTALLVARLELLWLCPLMCRLWDMPSALVLRMLPSLPTAAPLDSSSDRCISWFEQQDVADVQKGLPLVVLVALSGATGLWPCVLEGCVIV